MNCTFNLSRKAKKNDGILTLLQENNISLFCLVNLKIACIYQEIDDVSNVCVVCSTQIR